MKKNLTICLVAGLMLALPRVLQAQDSDEASEPTFSITGSVDTYFHTQIGTEETHPATAFADGKGFALGMANLVAAYDGEKAGFKADLVFGPRGTEAVFNSPLTSSEIVNQLYAYWKPSENLTLTLGNFNTFVGYEVISPTLNFNYSTSYMFSYGPFSHTGLKANYTFGSGNNILLAVMNPTDWTEQNPVDTYTVGAQLGHSGDAGFVYLNLLYGDQTGSSDSTDATFQVDLTGGWTLSDAFYLGVNATYNTTAVKVGDAGSFYGFAVYPKITMSDNTAIGLRAEYFAFTNYYLGVVAPDPATGDGNVIDLTLSLNQKFGSLTVIPEIRVDMAGEDSWYKKDSTTEYTKTMPTFNLAFVYGF